MDFTSKSGPILALIALLAGGAGVHGAELPFGYKYLMFAVAYRAANTAGSAGQCVVLGHYDFSDEAVTLHYFFYDARRNLQSGSTPLRHPRLIPGSAATPGPIQIPTYTLFDQASGSWSIDRAKGLLRVRLGSLVHEWLLRDESEHLFVPAGAYLNADNGSHSSGGWTYSDTRGYAYLSNYLTLPRKISRDDLLPHYQGEIQSLITPRGGVSQWTQKKSDLHVQRYQTSSDGDVLGYMVSSRWVSTPTVVFTTLLLNYAPHSKLILYHNGGHDFNHNAVFDEPGHTMQMFGIYDGSKLARIVYIEHSYQNAGQPILSVGEYHAPRPAPAK